MATTKELPAILKWLRGAGGAAFMFGLGVLLLAGLFWPGSVLIDIGFGLLMIDLCYEPELKKLWKIGGIFVLFLLAALFNWRIVFAQAPLGVLSTMTDAEYPKGTKISGIPWRPEFTEVQFRFVNQTDNDYDNLNFLVKPTSAIAAIAQQSHLPNVSFADKQNMSARITSQGPNGQRVIVPMTMLATNAGYRVLCEHLRASSDLQIVIAIATIKNSPPRPAIPMKMSKDDILAIDFPDSSTYWYGYADGHVFTPRPTVPEWIIVEGTYMSGLKTFSISEKVKTGKLP